ncbi:peptide chain release factor N(5)-glutamine methyltransferase [Lacihabitans sp. LS3-19]|uniref:peptide chain release factor N(5)-glutamine methyltransferase n=1 Tax=Lacihabitans sp. LS3-19 TaxID=2487335 RepID=UPI0020CDE67C|nr:peptide chain release factor N(5)-glutamine methyltransferase [Lacihabitans sp. LS3-19]MCP9770702.1 peptide chain release factor N(5)-glutamine methyltransferase [Lacihabitans sp. LS3-19]
MLDLKTEYQKICEALKVYDKEEAKEIAFLLLNHLLGISKNDIITSKTVKEAEMKDLGTYIERLNNWEPLQYITNKTWFFEHDFFVDQNVLIPRPETEELVSLAIALKPKTVLDLGTGSGCIPISIALTLENSRVFAIDISENALKVAQKNTSNLNANVKFEKASILDFENPFDTAEFDLIISNPPYVKENEKPEIRQNVLNFEPHLALFVTDNDPLIFYKKIAEIGLKHLKQNGCILVEINTYLGPETCEVFRNAGFSKVELIKDFFEKDRMIRVNR